MSTGLFISSSGSPPNSAPPSKVVHIRNVTADITEQILKSALDPFGLVERVFILKGKNQALVQFESLNGAITFINHCQSATFRIGQTTIYSQFSTHTSIEASTSPSSGTNPSRILLVSIANPSYAINVSILSTVFSHFETGPTKNVEKIVIFEKTAGLQALIQYSNVESAKNAKVELDGKNIYSGCCTLSIAYSNLTDLIIKEQSDKTRDYTRTDLPERPPDALMDQTTAPRRQPGIMGVAGTPIPGAPGPSPAAMGMGGDQQRGCVLLVTGFPAGRVGCNELFNLFSNYGTIVRIKIMHSKTHMAFVQFEELQHAQNAMTHLRYAKLFGGHLQINYSHHASITQAPRRPTSGGPGSVESDPKTVEFIDSPLNRFKRYGGTNPRNLSSPTDILHVSNVSPKTTAETLSAIIGKSVPVLHVKCYEKAGKSMALAQFQSQEHAVEAMCLLHNTLVDGLHIRLAFTKNKI